MPDLEQRIAAFIKLGNILASLADEQDQSIENETELKNGVNELNQLIHESYLYNGWFTADQVRFMFRSIAEVLHPEKIDKWIMPHYDFFKSNQQPRSIGVVMAGNIPAVGFHDLLTVLITGNRLKAKLSGSDHKIIPAIAEILINIEPGFNGFIEFTTDKLSDFDAVIATGSNNTSRYFEYYFGKYPHIIRKNRHGLAVMSGKESSSELHGLCNDIFRYYGLGCRNVSKILVPDEYDFDPLVAALKNQISIVENHKYFNNYEYNKAIFLVNGTQHIDTGNLLITKNDDISSPISVVYYQYYSDPEDAQKFITENADHIQCVIAHNEIHDYAIPFGHSQVPELWDYADGVDTLSFLKSLK